MCGILGHISITGDLVSQACFSHALDQLAHRGPDDRGIHTDTTSTGVRIHLGHTRLSILDLSEAGHQPMLSPRTGSCIVYNGEVYNFHDLRKRLESLGFSFSSHCDTEVVLAAYDAWGDQCVNEFQGMYALAIWDRAENRIVLARDRAGIKPLYYYWDGRQLAFASEITSLVAMPSLELKISHDAVHQYLLYGYIPNPLSIYENVRKLPAGCLMVCDLDVPRPAERRYWDVLDHYSNPGSFGRESEIIEGLHAVLRQAVERRLISDVPLGAFLSGGIDSSLVVALMREVHSGTIRTFTIGFSEQEWNEAPAAKRIADHLNTDHEELYLTEQNVLDAALTVADHSDEPFADASSIPTLMLSRLTREHVTVSLSGDGGDELFWGYNTYKSRTLGLFNLVDALPSAIRRIASPILKWSRGTRFETGGDLFDYVDFPSYFLRPTQWRPWLYPRLFRASSNDDRLHDIGREVVSRLGDKDHSLIIGAMNFMGYMVDDILTKVDRASMSVSLEARVPILDHDVVEYAASIPSSFKSADGELKHLLKQLLATLIPRPLWDRPKQGFGVPLVRWFRSSLKDWSHDVLAERGAPIHDWLDPHVLREILDDHGAGRRDCSAVIWTSLQFAEWDRRMKSIRQGCHATADVSSC